MSTTTKQLPSCKLQRSFKGDVSHLNYQEFLKEADAAVVLKYKASNESNVSGNAVVKEMQVALATNDIEISKSTCWTHLRADLSNNGIAIYPQKPGVASLPSHIEKKIARPTWEHGFTVERNIKGWRLEGLIPFKRNAIWRKHVANAQPLSMLRAST
jgi:hypothetical protein